jgi:hypothetical protein
MGPLGIRGQGIRIRSFESGRGPHPPQLGLVCGRYGPPDAEE